ncbi:MAG: class I SAM-dependent methyltransferase [Burkholderiales bacterium]|nr:class I SAM-dependent methyltransferase [Burkholderiales bacterium]
MEKAFQSGATRPVVHIHDHFYGLAMLPCSLCGNAEQNVIHSAREMMFGTKDEFTYIECAVCGCLQLANIPADLSRYYPREYYSLKRAHVNPDTPLARFMRLRRTAYYLGGKTLIGSLIARIRGAPFWLEWFKHSLVSLDSAVLDVGCGTGEALLSLRREGFRNLTGVDPFITEDIHYEEGVTVFKREPAQLQGQFDVIMLHHSYEHMPNQLQTLQTLHALLKSNGTLLIRVPLASSLAWKKYGTNWVQLDPPRHLFLHTTRSMQLLAAQAKFVIAEIAYDSNALQFWGSEQYTKNIPFLSEQSWAKHPEQSIFTKEQIAEFERQAQALNKAEQGDQACFYMHKI